MTPVSKNINDSLRIVWKLWRSFMHVIQSCFALFVGSLVIGAHPHFLTICKQEVWVQPKLSGFQQHSIQQYELWIRIILPSYCCGAITVEVGSVAFNHLVTSLNSHIMSSCSCRCALGWAQRLPKLPKLPKTNANNCPNPNAQTAPPLAVQPLPTEHVAIYCLEFQHGCWK